MDPGTRCLRDDHSSNSHIFNIVLFAHLDGESGHPHVESLAEYSDVAQLLVIRFPLRRVRCRAQLLDPFSLPKYLHATERAAS